MNKKVKLRRITFLIILLLSMIVLVAKSMAHRDEDTSSTPNSFELENWDSNWEKVKHNYEQIALTPGKDESELNFGWYSKKPGEAKIRFSESHNRNHPVLFEGTSQRCKQMNGTDYYSNKVTVTALRPNHVYYYQYYLNGKWTEEVKYETKDIEEFSFLFVGDPQIGASLGQSTSSNSNPLTEEEASKKDAFHWNATLETAVKAYPKISFVLSAGDQVNEMVKKKTREQDSLQEMQYAGFLSPKLLTSLPVATTIGNHDCLTSNYQNHFNNPNSFLQATTPSIAGYNYYFTYGDVLFLFLDGNNTNGKDHEEFLKKATKANPNVKWRIVTLHQDIYGYGVNHAATDGMVLRTQLTPMMDTYGIDVVLQGHDHTYSRSYQLVGDGQEHQFYDDKVDLRNPQSYKEFYLQNQCYKIVTPYKNRSDHTVYRPKGVVYIEGGSSTGSKYYEGKRSGFSYISFKSLIYNPNYSVINITDTSFSINTYDVITGNRLDNYTIMKSDKPKNK